MHLTSVCLSCLFIVVFHCVIIICIQRQCFQEVQKTFKEWNIQIMDGEPIGCCFGHHW